MINKKGNYKAKYWKTKSQNVGYAPLMPWVFLQDLLGTTLHLSSSCSVKRLLSMHTRFRHVFMTLIHVSVNLTLSKLLPSSNFLHLIDLERSSVLPSWPNKSNCLVCKQSLILTNCCPYLGLIVTILSFDLTLHTHQIIIPSFLSGLITLFSIFLWILLPHSVILCTKTEYNLPFARKGKTLHLQVNKR